MKAERAREEAAWDLKRPLPMDRPKPPWPKPIGAAGRYGLTGRFIDTVAAHTEADPNWMTVLFLVYAGSLFGRCAWINRDGYHYPNLFACAVGKTSGGRKGSAFFLVERFFRSIDDEWFGHFASGLSSGEGLIWAVRDEIVRMEKDKKSGTYKETVVDEGVSDKRLLIRQSEFYGVLQAIRRQGNTLSSTIRDAWDKGDLRSLVKNSPAQATGAHISIAGNIPPDELRRGLLAEDIDSGFANRFLWCCSARSRFLPEGGRNLDAELDELRRDFNRNRPDVHQEREIGLSGDAQDIWGYNETPENGVYRKLAGERWGMFGTVTARAPQQVLRLSLIYALLDGSAEIRREQLEAALEIWRYSEESCRWIFGDALGDPLADAILSQLRSRAQGMTRTEIREFFQRNKSSAQIQAALDLLREHGVARFELEESDGIRRAERWFAA